MRARAGVGLVGCGVGKGGEGAKQEEMAHAWLC
jgi:hypothetical protein